MGPQIQHAEPVLGAMPAKHDLTSDLHEYAHLSTRGRNMEEANFPLEARWRARPGSDYGNTGLKSKPGDRCLPRDSTVPHVPGANYFVLRASIPQSETLLNSEANAPVPEGSPSPLEVIITLI